MRHLLIAALLLSSSLTLPARCLAAEGDCAVRVKNSYAIGPVIYNQFGTGVAVGSNQVLTAAHVVQGADDVFIQGPAGWLIARVVRRDLIDDLALLECTAELHPVELDPAPAVMGQHMTIWGSPNAQPIRAIAAEVYSAWDWGKYKGGFICIASGFDHGGSGAPVLRDGKLAGLAVAINGEQTKQPICVSGEKVYDFVNSIIEEEHGPRSTIGTARVTLTEDRVFCKSCEIAKQLAAPVIEWAREHTQTRRWVEDEHGQGHFERE